MSFLSKIPCWHMLGSQRRFSYIMTWPPRRLCSAIWWLRRSLCRKQHCLVEGGLAWDVSEENGTGCGWCAFPSAPIMANFGSWFKTHWIAVCVMCSLCLISGPISFSGLKVYRTSKRKMLLEEIGCSDVLVLQSKYTRRVLDGPVDWTHSPLEMVCCNWLSVCGRCVSHAW